MDISIHVRDGHVVAVHSPDPVLQGLDVTVVVDGQGDAIRRIRHQCIENFVRQYAEASERHAVHDIRAACSVFSGELQALCAEENLSSDQLVAEIGKLSNLFNVAISNAVVMQTASRVRQIQQCAGTR